MRDPRPGLAWSRGRVAKRRAYADWMASAAWHRRRESWRKQWVDAHGTEPLCVICGGAWTLRGGDLHHRTYARLGHERFADVISLCRPCHDRLHQIMESTPAWRKMGRRHATDLIVATLAVRHATREGVGDG